MLENKGSPRNLITLELPTPSQYILPEIRNSLERNSITNVRRSSNSAAKKKPSAEIPQAKPKNEIPNSNYPSMESNEIRELTER